ncbi:MAG TPA: N-acetylglucosamine-6-phosphate deacetylase, partial [Pyrinomonadaceae bacterium]|nr:N-acetylglucosamine-6-phosphate deacetylase [Pyrinomonadaceae bacterium]
MKNGQTRDGNLLLKDACVVLPQKVSEGASLLVKDGRIARIFEAGEEFNDKAEETYDLKGLTLFPGFIDVHIHGAIGIDTMEASAEDLSRVGSFLARNGVTAWLPTLVPAPFEDYERAVQAIEKHIGEQDKGAVAARALGVHYEGPFINSAQCGALRPAYFQTFKSACEIDSLPCIKQGAAAHMITVAPEVEGGVELIKELVARGWIVSIGHTRAEVDVLDRAHRAGAHHMTHFMNAMSPLHHRSPGPVGWGLMSDEVSCDVIADGVHLDPLMLKLVLRAKSTARVALISDSVAPTGLGDGDFQIWGETISVIRGRTSNARGHIAGSVITMRDAVRTMLSLSVRLEDIARMASSNPARLLGVAQAYGSIEEGKRADL